MLGGFRELGGIASVDECRPSERELIIGDARVISVPRSVFNSSPC